jgi:hypothetical protein
MAEKSKALAKGFKLPKPPPPREPVREEDARRFESSTGPSRGARSSPRRRAESGERLTAYLPPDLKIALEVRCAQERRSVSDAVTEALDAWMKAGAK